MSIYGCPDQELNNWKYRHVDALKSYSELSQKHDLDYVGPFDAYRYPNYFCVKERVSNEPSIVKHNSLDWQKTVTTSAEWPRGNYGIYPMMNDECPSGEFILYHPVNLFILSNPVIQCIHILLYKIMNWCEYLNFD